ncbi:class I SAM-dependent methyltransferase [Thiotrichales bacterium 19X7-9]|nr:class I SAM-dependent methyltransferase [Thiotrichales bacterium 19X7-9]
MQHFSPATERNKAPILEQLIQWLNGNESILEIGSSSGQHGVYFTESMPNLAWQFSDRKIYLAGLAENILNTNRSNLSLPIELDVVDYDWSTKKYDAIFSANTIHIMLDHEVEYFLNHVHLALKHNGKLIIYGPFNYQGNYTSESNKAFDLSLKQQGYGGIKPFERLDSMLSQCGFKLQKDIDMPANNRLLMWQLV